VLKTWEIEPNPLDVDLVRNAIIVEANNANTHKPNPVVWNFKPVTGPQNFRTVQNVDPPRAWLHYRMRPLIFALLIPVMIFIWVILKMKRTSADSSSLEKNAASVQRK
jgi:hypothetical protein